jgi:hypothetical protein
MTTCTGRVSVRVWDALCLCMRAERIFLFLFFSTRARALSPARPPPPPASAPSHARTRNKHTHKTGIYHCGLVVYGSEIAFGGHEFPTSGIFRTAPGDVPGARFRESVPLGETSLTAAEVAALVEDLGRTSFRGCDYSLLQRNCNHLTAVLAEALTGRPAPAWPNRLADVALALHCLLPSSLVQPPLATPSGAPGGSGMSGAPLPPPQGAGVEEGGGGRGGGVGAAGLGGDEDDGGAGEATALLLRAPGGPGAMQRGR